MNSKMSPTKFLSIWENYWGKLSPEWAKKFINDKQIEVILNYPDLLILQAVQENNKLENILIFLEKSSKQRAKLTHLVEDRFSRTNIDVQIGLGSESEITEIRQWLSEMNRAEFNPDETFSWLNVLTDKDTCSNKKVYASEKDAILGLIWLGKQKGELIKQLPYKCNSCREFHNSHLISRETIANLVQKYS